VSQVLDWVGVCAVEARSYAPRKLPQSWIRCSAPWQARVSCETFSKSTCIHLLRVRMSAVDRHQQFWRPLGSGVSCQGQGQGLMPEAFSCVCEAQLHACALGAHFASLMHVCGASPLCSEPQLNVCARKGSTWAVSGISEWPQVKSTVMSGLEPLGSAALPMWRRRATFY
jgi:hypothetical protein